MLRDSEIEYNGYPPIVKAPSLSEEGIKTNMPSAQPEDTNIPFSEGGTRMVARDFKSTNFSSGSKGWVLRVDGTSEITVSYPTVSTHFRKMITDAVNGISVWVSDGTTPNGNLSGTAGDICLNGASNKPYYCTSGTNWTALV